MKIKVFTVVHSNQMEELVDRWLRENPGIEIQHVRQSESMNTTSWSMTLTILYIESSKTRIGFEGATGGGETAKL